MAEQRAAPDAVAEIRISRVLCDIQSGGLRCIAELADGNTTADIKAIWRNDPGPAVCTPPRVRRR